MSPVSPLRRVARDLLPLPLLSERLPVPRSLSLHSRSVEQRFSRRLKEVREANRCIQALNECWDEDVSPPLHPSAAQFCTVERLLKAAAADPPPLDVPSPQAALRELLGAKASVYGTGGLTQMADFNIDLVSWPEQAGVVELQSVLEGRDQADLADVVGRLLLPAQELKERQLAGGPARPYWDSILKQDTSTYEEFIRQLHVRGMITFTVSELIKFRFKRLAN